MDPSATVPDDSQLERFAAEHHVSYRVEPELPAGSGQGIGPLEVRLFASGSEERLEAPLCPKCVDLTRELRSFAQQVVAAAGASSRAELVDSEPVLYASPDPRGPDEVSVLIRVFEERRPERRADDRELSILRDRLGALGVPLR